MIEETNPSQGIPAGTNFPAAPEGKPEGQEPVPGQPQGANNPEGAPPPVKLDEPVEGEKQPNPDTSNEFSYEPTGDAGLDYALSFVGKLGYGDSHPAIIAAQQGDFTLIRAELATQGVAGAEAVVALAEQSYERFQKEDAAKAQELANFAAEAAGSAENWAVVRGWAASEATPAEKAQVNAALAQGGIVAQGVIGQLVALYQQKHTLPKQAADVAVPGAAGSAAPATGPMTAKAYAEAVHALQMKYGNQVDGNPEYAALQAQRLAAKRAGY